MTLAERMAAHSKKDHTTKTVPASTRSHSPPQPMRIRELAEAIDAHRKRQQAQHPKLKVYQKSSYLAEAVRGVNGSAGSNWLEVSPE